MGFLKRPLVRNHPSTSETEMPFPNVTLHGVERNFEQVLSSIVAHTRALFAYSQPDSDGWTINDDFAALETMVADSSDKLWSAAIDENGNSRAALLEARVATLELEQGRLTEQLSSLQVIQGKE
jgi:hypothetical protein